MSFERPIIPVGPIEKDPISYEWEYYYEAFQKKQAALHPKPAPPNPLTTFATSLSSSLSCAVINVTTSVSSALNTISASVSNAVKSDSNNVSAASTNATSTVQNASATTVANLTSSLSNSSLKISHAYSKVTLPLAKMCFPCVTYSDVYLEDEPKDKKKKKKDKNKAQGVVCYDPTSRTYVNVTGVPMQYINQQPMVYGAAGPSTFVQPPAAVYQPAQHFQGTYSQYLNQNPHYGHTGAEILGQQLNFAEASGINEKQEMKPADDNPARFYWVRELDDSWTQRNRFTIDSGDIGECRWYSQDGSWYAVRLPSS